MTDPQADAATFLQVQAVRKAFGGEGVLHDVSFNVAQHETLGVLGPSGCGKTTLLKIIAGLETADAGAIQLEGQDLTGLPPQDRGVAYLYQEPLLFPHLDVFENIAFGLRLRKLSDDEVSRRVDEMLANLELEAHARKQPDQLSGGQRQRVAFGRAIIIRPRLLLLDEPFGNLDVEIRASMQQLFQHLVHQFEITSLFVTHDLKEAILMGDRLASLRAGRFRTYPDTRAFIADPDAGVMQELAFWDDLKQRHT